MTEKTREREVGLSCSSNQQGSAVCHSDWNIEGLSECKIILDGTFIHFSQVCFFQFL